MVGLGNETFASGGTSLIIVSGEGDGMAAWADVEGLAPNAGAGGGVATIDGSDPGLYAK